jgi:hypothetical protein
VRLLDAEAQPRPQVAVSFPDMIYIVLGVIGLVGAVVGFVLLARATIWEAGFWPPQELSSPR